ncbi:hypothetical protein CHS0354_032604 [Potamilus streckersoni]|uniref:Uncharacterized protein n=1 Tax=Potamilus streckersoni TaxID=2493646 RepID=A0AAE0T881_9BIVA|nr:hypothetical protein CHS0354_032604 [Potamilus streckersoni]
MKVFIILVITVFLVGLHASSIAKFPKKFEDEDNTDIEELLSLIEEVMSDEDRNEATMEQGEGDISLIDDALYEAQTFKITDDTLDFLQHYKDVMGCSGNTCRMCYKSACVSITYMASSKQFRVSVSYSGFTIFSRTFAAKDFRYCKTKRFRFMRVTACVEIRNLRISNGRACMDLKVSLSRFSKTFYNLCM